MASFRFKSAHSFAEMDRTVAFISMDWIFAVQLDKEHRRVIGAVHRWKNHNDHNFHAWFSSSGHPLV